MTSFRSSAIFCALLSVLMILFAAQAIGQTVTGTISGTVKDSSGLVLPAAKVEVVNQDTGSARTIQSDTAGRYSALLLPLGSYKVTAKLQRISDGIPGWNCADGGTRSSGGSDVVCGRYDADGGNSRRSPSDQ